MTNSSRVQMAMEYFDKNGIEIKPGMKIKHDNGDVESVYLNADEDDMGINASNENFVGFANSSRQIYPLYQFNLKEWVVLEDNEQEPTMREFWKELDRVPGTFIAGDIVHDTKGEIYTVFPNPTKFPGSLTIAEAEELYKQGKLQSIADDEGYILHFPK